MKHVLSRAVVALAFAGWASVCAAQSSSPAFRTDTSENPKLPWFKLVEGAFPPPGSEHSIGGDLIGLDHTERAFVLRVDRRLGPGSSRLPGGFDNLPLAAQLLPYGSVFYRGAAAALEDIPLGTHLHGQFYIKHPDDPAKPIPGEAGRITPEAAFTRCLRLEDDFSRDQRLGRSWKIESVDFAKRQITAVPHEKGMPCGAATVFDLLDSTRVWKGKGFESPEVLAPGQTVLFNLTWSTVFGPGRLLEVWVDEEARAAATAHQRKVHRQHIEDRGLPGWITAVDDAARTITVTLFDGVDSQFFEGIQAKKTATVATARENLGTFEPSRDGRKGIIKAVRSIAPAPGGSGVEFDFQSSTLLLEGFRAKRIVRVYPESFQSMELPREWRWKGREYEHLPLGK
ncbi:MAG: hypothetical protein RLZZ399_2167 [Verrucomicrobiota bacterium]|jgi:hypothetical protein